MANSTAMSYPYPPRSNTNNEREYYHNPTHNPYVQWMKSLFGHPRKVLPECASSPSGSSEETFIRDVWQAWDGERPEQTKALVDNVKLIGGTALQLLEVVDGMDEALRRIPELTIRDGVIRVKVREYRNRVISETGARNPGLESPDSMWEEEEVFKFHDAGFETTTEFANSPAKLMNYQRKVDQMDGDINLTWSLSILREVVDRGQLQHDNLAVVGAPFSKQVFNRMLSTREERRFALQKSGTAWDGLETAAFGAIRARTGKDADTIVTTAGSLRMANVVRRDRQDYRLAGGQADSNRKGLVATDPYGEARSRVYNLKVLESQEFTSDDGEVCDPTVSSEVYVSQRFHLLSSKVSEISKEYRTPDVRTEIMDGDICDWKDIGISKLMTHSGVVNSGKIDYEVPENILKDLSTSADGRVAGASLGAIWKSQGREHAFRVMLAGREKDWSDQEIPLPYIGGYKARNSRMSMAPVKTFIDRMREAGVKGNVERFVDELQSKVGELKDGHVVKVTCTPLPYDKSGDGEASWYVHGNVVDITVPFDDEEDSWKDYNLAAAYKTGLGGSDLEKNSVNRAVREVHDAARIVYAKFEVDFEQFVEYDMAKKIVKGVARCTLASASKNLKDYYTSLSTHGLKQNVFDAANGKSDFLAQYIATNADVATDASSLGSSKLPKPMGSQWVKHIMSLDMRKGESWTFLAGIDVPVPVSFLMFRHRIRFETGSMTMLCSGIETGAIIVRDKRVVFNVSNNSQSLGVRASFRAATIILRPENIEHIPDIISVGYRGGAGTKFVPYGGNPDEGDMYAVAVPYNFVPEDFYTDMTGKVSNKLLRAGNNQHTNKLDYPTAEHYKAKFGWETGDDMLFFCNPEAQAQGHAQVPTLMVQGHQKYFNPRTGQCDITVAGKDAYGAITSPESYASFQHVGSGRNVAEVFRM